MRRSLYAVSTGPPYRQPSWFSWFQRLRDQDPTATPALLWLNERLAALGTTAEQIVREEYQRQSALNVTVRNVITSMRFISAVDWAEFFESVSLVDDALRAASDFAEMDFPTRDRYRHAIEELARGSGTPELVVARRAIAAAVRAATRLLTVGDVSDRREEEPGYYLISKERRVLEKELGFRIPASDWLIRTAAASGILGYAGAIAFLAASMLGLPLLGVAECGILSGWSILLLALLALAPASDLAVALVNRAVTNDLDPKTLPALALRDGVPASLRTLVVVPTLLMTAAELDEQIELLEVHFLASQDGDLHFALLSDWTDCTTLSASGDDELLCAAAEGIARLNRQYGSTSECARFFLFHRRRVWNQGQGKWIGWERKRGKLHELNRLLRRDRQDFYRNRRLSA
jgi:cyclic beta-1,2-glucan synthetase